MLQFLQLQSWLEESSKPSCPQPFYPACLPLVADSHPFNSTTPTICMFKLLTTAWNHTLSRLGLPFIFSCCVTRGNAIWHLSIDTAPPVWKRGMERRTQNGSQRLGVERQITASPLLQRLGYPLAHLSSCPYSTEVLLLPWNGTKLSCALAIKNVILYLSKNLHE